MYPNAAPPAPRWIFHDLEGKVANELRHGREAMTNLRRYHLTGIEPLANRPANLRTVYESGGAPNREASLDTAYATLFHPNMVHHQLRTLLYQAGSVALYIGLYRWRTEADFSLEEHARLHAVQDAIGRFVLGWELLGLHSQEPSIVAQILDGLESPAMLMDEQRILFVNAEGRRSPQWIERARHSATPEHARRIQIGERTFMVVSAKKATAGAMTSLPPALQRTGALLSEGLATPQLATRYPRHPHFIEKTSALSHGTPRAFPCNMSALCTEKAARSAPSRWRRIATPLRARVTP